MNFRLLINVDITVYFEKKDLDEALPSTSDLRYSICIDFQIDFDIFSIKLFWPVGGSNP